VIYPPSLEKLEMVLVTGNVGFDREDGHEIAYQRILSACATHENPPKLFSSECQDFGGLEITDKIPGWMNIAGEISIGGRRQVLEDGRDVCNSESDS
jgi:hypothetical protein